MTEKMPDQKNTGTVTDKKKAPLPGVTVLIKGTSIGVATDMNGKFEMIQPKDSNIVLIISFIGMKNAERSFNEGKR